MTVINRRVTARADVEPLRTEREGPTLDYKGDVDPAEWWELAKDVAAFANHIGGVLLIGAHEDKVTRFPNLIGHDPAHIADLKRAYDNIGRDRCRPAVIATAHVIPWDNGKELLAVNVEAYPAALVGAQFYALDTNSKPQSANAWQFPIRVDDDNVPLTPETMPMYMSTNIRRALVLLHSIPADAYARVHVAHSLTDPSNGRVFFPEPVTLRSFGIATNSVNVLFRGHLVSVPLDDVDAVWTDDLGMAWYLGVKGQLFYGPDFSGKPCVVYLRGQR